MSSCRVKKGCKVADSLEFCWYTTDLTGKRRQPQWGIVVDSSYLLCKLLSLTSNYIVFNVDLKIHSAVLTENNFSISYFSMSSEFRFSSGIIIAFNHIQVIVYPCQSVNQTPRPLNPSNTAFLPRWYRYGTTVNHPPENEWGLGTLPARTLYSVTFGLPTLTLQAYSTSLETLRLQPWKRRTLAFKAVDHRRTTGAVIVTRAETEKVWSLARRTL